MIFTLPHEKHFKEFAWAKWYSKNTNKENQHYKRAVLIILGIYSNPGKNSNKNLILCQGEWQENVRNGRGRIMKRKRVWKIRCLFISLVKHTEIYSHNFKFNSQFSTGREKGNSYHISEHQRWKLEMHQDLGELPLLPIFHIGCHMLLPKEFFALSQLHLGEEYWWCSYLVFSGLHPPCKPFSFANFILYTFATINYNCEY